MSQPAVSSSPPTYTPQSLDRPEKGTNSFWELFRSLPVINAISSNIFNAYDSVKAAPIIGVGVRIMEGSCQSVLKEVKPCTNSLPVKVLDDLACGVLFAIENNFEIVRKTPEEIGQDIKTTLNNGVEVFVQTFPGQLALSGLELAVSASESALNVIDQREDEIDNENEPDETDGETTPGGRQATIDELWGLKSKKECETTSFIYKPIKWMRRLVATPFYVSNMVLKGVYNWLKNFDKSLDPEKRKEIEGRRKLTARRHYSNSLVRRIVNALSPLKSMLMMIGVIDEHQIRKLLHITGNESVDTSPVKSSNDRGTKRDYSDVADELEYVVENYKSGEDEDYVQPSNVSTDSDEYNEGETESDIETQLKAEQDSYSLPTSTDRLSKPPSVMTNGLAAESKEVNKNSTTKPTVTVEPAAIQKI
ncbi:uncharacterized protein [Antedon mediterranea]|uniref:uncharacterized protein n=1 Tax=Antedon mediterranea TaxID=105859 RepID=UPI003AF92C8A